MLRDPDARTIVSSYPACDSPRRLLQAFFPHVVEPALGLNRLLLAMLCDGLVEETLPSTSAEGGDGESDECDESLPSVLLFARCVGATSTRTVFRVKPALAPYQAAVLPLTKREAQLHAAAALHAGLLERDVVADYDTTQSIGKRYRRQDAVGTPLCITVDERGATDGTATIRDRDSMAQVRLPVTEVLARGASRTLTPELLFSVGQ